MGKTVDVVNNGKLVARGLVVEVKEGWVAVKELSGLCHEWPAEWLVY